MVGTPHTDAAEWRAKTVGAMNISAAALTRSRYWSQGCSALQASPSSVDALAHPDNRARLAALGHLFGRDPLLDVLAGEDQSG